jgi:3-deoxy-7-phosphoheptulonate synthase
MLPTQNLNVVQTLRLTPPRALKDEVKMTESVNQTVIQGREEIKNILQKNDPRMLVIVGPCSIHNPKEALEYATKLAKLREELKDQFHILMRVYFEKPRTTRGWKGLINDPHMDDSCDISTGIKIARRLLLDITSLGLPTATEFLDPIMPQYIADLISWAAIGARTTESQTHREMSSGLSMPVGFKNGTDGNLQIAIDAMHSAMGPHSFLGIDQDGVTSVIRTRGNSLGHVVLRGGKARPNYDPTSIQEAMLQLKKEKLPDVLMVDCSHANSGKKHSQQEEVWRSVIEQRVSGNSGLIGLMVESYLVEGNQSITKNPADLKYGVSITDECIGWETTERILRYGHKLLSDAACAAR